MTLNVTTIPDSEISSLTDSQERILSSLTIFSSCMSILGSSMIVYLVLKNSRKTPYKRILLGLSLADIIASTAWALSPFLGPTDSSQRVWASGNDATCNLLGFLFQLSFAAVWYNGMLSYYYLLTVRFRVKTDTFAMRYEPWVHVLSIGYNVLAAIVGSAKGYYNEMELGQGCYIAEYPDGCEVNGGCTGAIIGWIVSGAPTVIFFIGILVNNAIIYCYVRQTTNRTMNKSMQGRNHQSRRIQAVATQAILYVGTFLMAYCWAFAVRVAESMGVQAADEARIYPVLVLSSFFLPLQGVFNLLVYSRPNYLKIRQAYPKESRLFALRRAWFGESNNRFTSVDGTLWSRHVNLSKGPQASIPNVDQVRLRVSQQFSATYSVKDSLRRDIRMRDPFDWASTTVEGPSHYTTGKHYVGESINANNGDRQTGNHNDGDCQLSRQQRPESSLSAYPEESAEGTGVVGLSYHHDPSNPVMMDDGTAGPHHHSVSDAEPSHIMESCIDYGIMRAPSNPSSATVPPSYKVPKQVRMAVEDDDPDEPKIEDYWEGGAAGHNGNSSSTEIQFDDDKSVPNR